MNENQLFNDLDDDDIDTVEIEGVDAETIENLDDEAIVANNPLVELLTPRAKVKILLALIRLNGAKVSPTGIATRAKISTDTWYKNYETLLEYDVIEKAGSAGNSPLYRANMDSPIINHLESIRTLAGQNKLKRLIEDRQ
jgi:predicted transcriptional regulator